MSSSATKSWRQLADSVSRSRYIAANITNQIFGLNNLSYSVPIGILGLSPPPSALDVRYSLVLDTMVSQDLIASRAFSLDLRSVGSPNGSLIFGGVDTGKYTGSLAKLPIVDPADTPLGADRYWVNLTSVGLTLPNGTSGLLASGEMPVFLDSGGTFSRFPNVTFFAIGDAFPGAFWNETIGYYVVDCDMAEQTGSVDFGFGEDEDGKVISISYKDFIWNPSNKGQCVLGIQIDNSKSSPDPFYLMPAPDAPPSFYPLSGFSPCHYKLQSYLPVLPGLWRPFFYAFSN